MISPRIFCAFIPEVHEDHDVALLHIALEVFTGFPEASGILVIGFLGVSVSVLQLLQRSSIMLVGFRCRREGWKYRVSRFNPRNPYTLNPRTLQP